MYRGRTVGAVILAAGESTRMGGKVNKVYREVKGKTVLNHSIDTFLNSETVDELVLVFNEKDKHLMEERVLGKIGPGPSVELVPGGERRQDSSWAGLNGLSTDYVLVHDGARPNFSPELVEDLLEAALEAGAAFPGFKPVDTIRTAEKERFAGRTVDREELVRVQTPQCFERKLLLAALGEALEAGRYFTDDAGAVMGVKDVEPVIVPGERDNLKLTTEDDLKLLTPLLGR